MSVAAQLEEALLVERNEVITKATVQKLRKDFLTLMKNLKRVDTFAKAKKLHGAFRRWHVYYEKLLRDLQVQMQNAKSGSYLESGIDAAWSFNVELRDFPLELSKTNYNYQTDKFDPAPESQIFDAYKAEVKRWEQRARRWSRKAWKWFMDVADWHERLDKEAERGIDTSDIERFKLRTVDKENVSMAGFRVQVIGADQLPPSWSDPREILDNVERGLRHYKRRAQRVFPEMLRKQLPLIVDFTANMNSLDSPFATYEYQFIRIYGMQAALIKQADRFAKTLAHEMGHHLYKLMDRRAQKAWDDLIEGGRQKLDLRDVLAMQRAGEGDYEFEKRLEKEYPELKLQLDGLFWNPSTSDEIGLWSPSKLRDIIGKGRPPTVTVNRHPITAYANKNTEEAFCETVGMLVGYGPRTLHPEVRSWLRRFYPGFKEESLSAQLEDALTERKVRGPHRDLEHLLGLQYAIGISFDAAREGGQMCLKSQGAVRELCVALNDLVSAHRPEHFGIALPAERKSRQGLQLYIAALETALDRIRRDMTLDATQVQKVIRLARAASKALT